MKNTTWLRHLNPLHFETRYLHWAFLGQLFLTILFLVFGVLLYFYFIPKLQKFSKSVLFPEQIQHCDDASKLRSIILHQDRWHHKDISRLVDILSAISRLSVASALAFGMGAFCFRKAHQIIRELERNAQPKPEDDGKPAP